ncbi:ATP-binding protein [Streptomyces sp. NPDC058320]|uniref:ATP-binding protein n=1 Tax=Streptomyces sp. NPDC058320 TaxID=3346444 RepID=UPI0036F032F1
MNDFGFAAQPGVDEKLIRDLATLRFLDNASNVLLVGPPGVGKKMPGHTVIKSFSISGSASRTRQRTVRPQTSS